MNKNGAASMRGRLCGLLLTLGLAAGSAQAAVYTAVWDPAFGAPFANLGWRGNAAFFVPTSCEPAGTADISNAGACGNGAIVTHADVELYDVNAAGQPTLATLDFNASSLVIGTLRYVNGELAQLTTSFSDVVFPAEDLSALGVVSGVGFFVDFTLSGPRLGWITCDLGLRCESGFNDGTNFPPRFTITRAAVPEPGSQWLSGLALLGLLVARRATKGRN